MGQIPFQFNPKELSLQKAASGSASRTRDAKNAGPPEFKGSDPCKLTLEMFLDATDTIDAGGEEGRAALLLLRATDASAARQKGSPPWVIFNGAR